MLNIVRTNIQVQELLQYLKQFEYVALDLETTGLAKGSEIIGYSLCASEEEAYYVILAEWNSATQKLDYLETKDTAKQFMIEMTKKNLVGHNFLFDASMIEDNYGIHIMSALHTDTLLAAHILDENRPVGLKSLAAELFGESEVLEAAAVKDTPPPV